MTKLRVKRGIFYGWVIVAVSMASLIAAGPAQASVFSVFIGPIAEDFGWSRTFLSSVASLGMIVSAALAFVAGSLLDRSGPRYLMVVLGLALGLGSMGVGLSHDRASFMASYIVVRSVGVGLVVLVTTTTVANWFVRKRGRAMGATTLGMPLSIAIMAPLSQVLMGRFHWTTIWFFFSGIAFAIYLPGALLLYRRPEDRGLLPDCDIQPEERRVTDQPTRLRNPGSRPLEAQWTARQAVVTPTFWILAIASALHYLATAAVTMHQVPFMVDQGMDPTAAASIVGLYAVLAGAGTLLGGVLAERIPVRLGLSWSFLSTGLGLMALLWLPIHNGAIVYALLFGSAIGIRSTMEPVTWASYYGRASLGAIRGVSSPLAMLGNALGPVLGGVMYDYLAGYVPLFIALVLASWVGAGAILLARQPSPLASAVEGSGEGQRKI